MNSDGERLAAVAGCKRVAAAAVVGICVSGAFSASTGGLSSAAASQPSAPTVALTPAQAAELRAEHELASRSNALAQCMQSRQDAGHPSCASQRRAVQLAAARLTRRRRSSTRTPAGGESAARHIIGTNDGAGWGAGAAQTILAGHITWNRVEIGSTYNTVAQSLSDGFHVLAIVGNSAPDATPISSVEPAAWGSEVVSELKANPGIAIAEAGNEMYFKGGVANPVQYGRMYLAAVTAMRAAGIHTPLLFNMYGDVPTGGTWSSHTGWSRDSEGGGWLRDGVNATPGLAGAILENGVSSHPYGNLEENWNDDMGVQVVAAQESVARSVLGAVPRFYLTEYGLDLGRCGTSFGACSQPEQATKLTAAFKAFGADPHVSGIWWYESHDDGEGQWGFMNNDGSTRPAFAALSALAVEQGQ